MTNKKSKKIVITLIVIFITLFLGISIYNTKIKPNSEYKTAVELMENENYESAMNIFSSLANLKDSEKLYKTCCYKYGEQLFDAGQYLESYKFLDKIKNDYDVKDKLDTIALLDNVQGDWRGYHDIWDNLYVWGDYHSFEIIGQTINIYHYKEQNLTDKEDDYIKKIWSENGEIHFLSKRHGEYFLTKNENGEEILKEPPTQNNYTYFLKASILKEEIVPPSIGMTSEQVLNSTWGKPDHVNKTTTSFGVSEQWCYSHNKYIYIDDDIVTAIQE